MSALFHLNKRALLQRAIIQPLRYSRNISTSQKNRETAAISQITEKARTETVETKKNWVSYGYDYKDEVADRDSMKSTFFFALTLCLVWGSFVWSYLPDTHRRDWAQREAFLELRRREQAGVDLISPNYIDISKMKLPSDDELGDTDIII